METQRQWCDQKACPDFGKIGARNIKTYSHTARRYYCTTCTHTFSADKGTFFATLRTDRRMLLDAVAMLVERNSLRAISRIKQCKPHTVLHWLDLAGQHAAAVSTHFIRGLHVTQAQIDELWTFVKKNRRTCNRTTPALSVMPGSGRRLRCPVICGWSIISPMSAASTRPPYFWPPLRPALMADRPCLRATSCRRISKHSLPITVRLSLHHDTAGQGDHANTRQGCWIRHCVMPRSTNIVQGDGSLKSVGASCLVRRKSSQRFWATNKSTRLMLNVII
jgi:transposase-like protein